MNIYQNLEIGAFCLPTISEFKKYQTYHFCSLHNMCQQILRN